MHIQIEAKICVCTYLSTKEEIPRGCYSNMCSVISGKLHAQTLPTPRYTTSGLHVDFARCTTPVGWVMCLKDLSDALIGPYTLHSNWKKKEKEEELINLQKSKLIPCFGLIYDNFFAGTA